MFSFDFFQKVSFKYLMFLCKEGIVIEESVKIENKRIHINVCYGYNNCIYSESGPRELIFRIQKFLCMLFIYNDQNYRLKFFVWHSITKMLDSIMDRLLTTLSTDRFLFPFFLCISIIILLNEHHILRETNLFGIRIHSQPFRHVQCMPVSGSKTKD